MFLSQNSWDMLPENEKQKIRNSYKYHMNDIKNFPNDFDSIEPKAKVEMLESLFGKDNLIDSVESSSDEKDIENIEAMCFDEYEDLYYGSGYLDDERNLQMEI